MAPLFPRVMAAAIVGGVAPLLVMRGMVETGLGRGGSLRIGALPLEYFFLVWFLVFAALVADSRGLSDPSLARSRALQWWWTILGVAGTLWLVQQRGSISQMRSTSWAYWLASAAIWTTFVAGALSRSAGVLAVLRHILPDGLRLLGRPATWLCAFSILAVLGGAPRSGEVPVGGRAFERWLLRQPRATIPERWRPAPVTLIEFRDYQAPASREAALKYREVITTMSQTHGGAFAFLAADFPLEPECDSSGRLGPGRHPSSCEAAAAVRLAKQQSKDKAQRVADWLWEYQSVLTPEFVFSAMADRFELDLKAHYSQLLHVILQDTAEARRLRVSGVPTYFLNGRRLPPVSVETLAAAIAIELRLATQ